MYTVRKLFKFELAHKLRRAYSKCCTEQIHGHSYLCEVFLISAMLDMDDMVVDFGLIADKLKPMFELLDHSLWLPSRDEQLDKVYANDNVKVIFTSRNPTAEYMAKYIYDEACKYLASSIPDCVHIKKVRVHETSTGWAEYSKD